MNIRRGLIRLWLLASARSVALVGLMQYSTVRAEFTKAALESTYRITTDDGKKHIVRLPDFDKLEAMDRSPQQDADGWVQRARQYAREPGTYIPARPWHAVLTAAELATIPPALVLVLGRALGWVAAGFKW